MTDVSMETNAEGQEDRSGEERRDNERRGGMDRRCVVLEYDGEERRSEEAAERRNGWDRRRGPGRRRSDERRMAEEGEMNDEQFIFLRAIEEYKRVNKRPFPSYTEVLEIVKALGYRKVDEPKPLNKQ
jgi:hypothetical protein